MNRLVLILLLVPYFVTAQIKPDKYYHAIAGSTISVSIYTVGQYSEREMFKFAPELMGITAGFTKECFDGVNTGKFSYQDFAWTAASSIVTSQIIKLIWKRKKKKKYIDFYVEKQ
jgi:hypothetical protein